jgi:hypothetical protein
MTKPGHNARPRVEGTHTQSHLEHCVGLLDCGGDALQGTLLDALLLHLKLPLHPDDGRGVPVVRCLGCVPKVLHLQARVVAEGSRVARVVSDACTMRKEVPGPILRWAAGDGAGILRHTPSLQHRC